MLQGAYRAAQPILERARTLSVEQGDVAVEGEVLGALATCAYLQGDFAAVGALANAALEKPIGPRGRVQLLMSRADQALFTGAWQRAAQDLDAALEVALASEQPYILAVMTFNLSPSFAVLPGRLAAVERFCQQVEPFAQPLSPLRLALLELQAFLHLVARSFGPGDPGGRGRAGAQGAPRQATSSWAWRRPPHWPTPTRPAAAHDDAAALLCGAVCAAGTAAAGQPRLSRHYSHGAAAAWFRAAWTMFAAIDTRLDSSANTIRSDLVSAARAALRGLLVAGRWPHTTRPKWPSARRSR